MTNPNHDQAVPPSQEKAVPEASACPVAPTELTPPDNESGKYPHKNFPDVYQQELADFKARTPVWQPAVIGDAETLTDEQKLRREALANNLLGLAFSGGGIRSATFGLGCLQALAKQGILPKVHYLSTVSGGGYIGSWLAGWILREKENPLLAKSGVDPVQNVAKQLDPSRKLNAEATRGTEQKPIPRAEKRVIDAEPEPIHHLREYSNYLTPRLGIFSRDGWALIASYLRNLVLNQLLVVLAILALLFFVSLIIQTFAVAADLVYHKVPHLILVLRCCYGGVGVTLLWAFYNIYRSVEALPATPPHVRPAEDRAANERRVVLAQDFNVHVILLPLLCSAVLLTLLALCLHAPALAHWQWLSDQLNSTLQLPYGAWTMSGLVLVSLLLRQGFRHLWPPMNPDEQKKPGAAERMLGIVVSAFYLPLLMLALEGLTRGHGYWGKSYWIVMGCFMAMVHTSFTLRSWFCFERNPNTHLIRILSGLLPGFVGGVLLCLLMTWFHQYVRTTKTNDIYSEYYHLPVMISFGPPLLLVLFVFVEMLQVGILGRLMSDSRREWWASLSGLILLYATCWAVVFATTIFGTSIVFMPMDDWLAFGARVGVMAGWLATVLTGLAASYGPQTGRRRQPAAPLSISEYLARITPLLFLLGYYLLLCVLATLLIQMNTPQDEIDFLKKLRNCDGPAYLTRCPPFKWITDYSTQWNAMFVLLDLLFLLAVAGAWLLGRRVDVNVFSLQGMYMQRLVRAYLGASRPKQRDDFEQAHASAPSGCGLPARAPHPLTGFDPDDDLYLQQFRLGPDIGDAASSPASECSFPGPCLIINTTLNLADGPELAWQERKAESFVLTPHYCGSITTGFRPTHHFAGKYKKLSLGSAMGVSGAAISPNMGYHSSPSVAAFLTIFNARLGAWVGNPRKEDDWRQPGPRNGLLYLMKEALLRTNADGDYIYLSDGGHFENLGVYELVRRRCRFIICYDAGADPEYSFYDLAALIRKVRIDFGIRIDIDVSALRPQGPQGRSSRHCAIGKIHYGDVDASATSSNAQIPTGPLDLLGPGKKLHHQEGILIYIKPALTGAETPDIANYAVQNPAFPQEPTMDQFFTESQFESYRALGYHCVNELFEAALRHDPRRDDLAQVVQKIYDYWYVRPPEFTASLLQANSAYVAIHTELGKNELLQKFQQEIYAPPPERSVRNPREAQIERGLVAQMMTLMENTYYLLRFDDFFHHPVNSGWKEAFLRWAQTVTFKAYYVELSDEFSRPFKAFMQEEILSGAHEPRPPAPIPQTSNGPLVPSSDAK